MLRFFLRTLRYVFTIPVVIFFIVEGILRAIANWIEDHIPYSKLLERGRVWLSVQPYYVALPLFLVPETLSHVAGFIATLLMVEGHIISATIVAVVFKGFFTLVLVWIYNATEQTLLGVRWFAYVHGKLGSARRWALEKVRPIREWAAPKVAYVRKWFKVMAMRIRKFYRKEAA